MNAVWIDVHSLESWTEIVFLKRLPLRTDWNRIQKQERDQCQKSRKAGQWLRMEILL
jgi:hypothetical protein